MRILNLLRSSLTIFFSVAVLSWGCGDSSSSNVSSHSDSPNLGLGDGAAIAQRTKVLKKIFRAAPSPMETARIIQKEGAIFNEGYMCGLHLAKQDGVSSDHAIHLGIYGADLSYASVFQKNSESLKYMEAVKSLSTELGVGNVINDDVISRAEANRANRDSIVTIVSESFYNLNEQLKNKGHQDLSGLVVVSGWVEALYLATRDLDNASSELKQRIAEQKLILSDVLKLIDSYSDSPAIEGMITQLQPVVKAFDNVKYGKSTASTSKQEKGVVFIGGGRELQADDATILVIAGAIEDLRNNLVKAS